MFNSKINQNFSGANSCKKYSSSVSFNRRFVSDTPKIPVFINGKVKYSDHDALARVKLSSLELFGMAVNTAVKDIVDPLKHTLKNIWGK